MQELTAFYKVFLLEIPLRNFIFAVKLYKGALNTTDKLCKPSGLQEKEAV